MTPDLIIGVGFLILWFLVTALAAAMLTILLDVRGALGVKVATSVAISALISAASIAFILVVTEEGLSGELILGAGLISALGTLLIVWPTSYLAFRRYSRLSTPDYSMFE